MNEKAHYLRIINCVLHIMLVNWTLYSRPIAYYFLNIPKIAIVFKSSELSN